MSRDRRVLTLPRAIQRFVNHQSAEGKSERTLAHYEAILGYMAELLPADIDPLEITEDDLLDVLGSWRHLASTTRANRRSVLGSFFGWLARKYDCTDPTVNLGRPKKRPAARRRLAPDDVFKLLRAAADNQRDLVLVSVFAMTGIRLAEARGLRWRDFDPSQRSVIVKGKGGKSREVPIPVELADILADARARASEHGHADPNHYICPSRYEYQAGRSGIREETVHPDKPMGQSTPEKALHRLARKAGIPDPDHVGPHDLRRAYASIFLAANPGDIYRLQAILGHADIATTRIYLGDVDTLAARDAVDRVTFLTGPRRRPARVTNTDSTEGSEPPALGAEERTTGVEPALPASHQSTPAEVEPDADADGSPS